MAAITSVICNIRPLMQNNGGAMATVGSIVSKIHAQIHHAQLYVCDTNNQWTMFEFGPMENASKTAGGCDGKVTIKNCGDQLPKLDEYREYDVKKQISLADLINEAKKFCNTKYNVAAVLCQGVAAMSERSPCKPHNCQTFAEYLLHYLTDSCNIVNQLIMNRESVYHNLLQSGPALVANILSAAASAITFQKILLNTVRVIAEELLTIIAAMPALTNSAKEWVNFAAMLRNPDTVANFMTMELVQEFMKKPDAFAPLAKNGFIKAANSQLQLLLKLSEAQSKIASLSLTAAQNAGMTALGIDGIFALAFILFYFIKDPMQLSKGQIERNQLYRNTIKNLLVGILSTVAGSIGSAVGAAIGAAIGTLILPGFFTSAGGFIGNLVGGICGSMFGGWLAKRLLPDANEVRRR